MSDTRGIALTALLALAALGRADESPTPQNVRFNARLSALVPLDLSFKDETGKSVTLRELMLPGKPAILVLAYYRCPMLCNLVLNGLGDGLRDLARLRGLEPGKDFSVITVSIDPDEQPELAAAKKAAHLEHLGLPGRDIDWHFLTGETEAIKELASAVGFGYRYDPLTRQYAHGSGILVLTPEGRVSHAFYNVRFEANDLYYGMVEATQFRIGTVEDRAVLLFCFSYDPTTGHYRTTVVNIVRIAGVVTVLGLVVLVYLLRRREKRAARSFRAAGPLGI